MPRVLPLLLLGLVAAACGPIEPVLAPLEGLTLTLVAEDLAEPAGLAAPPGDGRLFVLERLGRVRVIDNGEVLTEPALDLSADTSTVGEQGLTGLAFHPDFRGNQKVYVLHNNASGNSRVLEYRMSSIHPNQFDPASERSVLELEQEDYFHQGGYLEFGPGGFLWITFGDGGSTGDDSFGHGQNPHTLHGAVLRIDVDGDRPYAIPPDNPFADGKRGAPEVWAYGFRNPWRIAFSESNGFLFVADVGQWSFEEVNITPLDEPGKNYGWPIVEGERCFQTLECEAENFTAAALIYGRNEGCAVIGGPVYRGDAIPELTGTYLFGDHCLGWIHGLLLDGRSIIEYHDWTDDLGAVTSLVSFGTDGAGEVYVLQRGGRVYRIDPIRER
jgi:glucose/arabinose dehydrogenase